MFRNNRPRYWVSWYDRWHLLLPLILLLLICMILWVSCTARLAATIFTAPTSGASLTTGRLGDVAGTAEPNSTVQIYDGSRLLGEVKADANGQFKFTLPSLDVGAHNLRAVASANNLSAESAQLPITVVAAAAAAPAATPTTAAPPQQAATPTSLPQPTATNVPQPTPTTAPQPTPTTAPQPTATAVAVVVPTITSPSAGAALPSDKPGEINGTAAPNAKIFIFDGDRKIGEATAGADGKWKFTLPTPFPVGSHSIFARAVDKDDKVLASSIELKVTSNAPAVAVIPTINSVPVAVGKLEALSGTAAPGATVRIFDGDKVVGEVKADDKGNWSLPLNPTLSEGAYRFTAAAIDAGREGTRSAVVNVLVVSPPTINLPNTTVLVGAVATAQGKAAPGSTVSVSAGERVLGSATAGNDGAWSVRLPADLQAGAYDVKASAKSNDGRTNYGDSATAKLNVVPPTTLPSAGAASPDNFAATVAVLGLVLLGGAMLLGARLLRFNQS